MKRNREDVSAMAGGLDTIGTQEEHAMGEKSPRTTLDIPAALLLEAKKRALDENTTLRLMLLEGLCIRLASVPPKQLKAAKERTLRLLKNEGLGLRAAKGGTE